MSGNFEERFKGKTSKMDKNGIGGVIDRNSTPATKESVQAYSPILPNSYTQARDPSLNNHYLQNRQQPASEVLIGNQQRISNKDLQNGVKDNARNPQMQRKTTSVGHSLKGNLPTNGNLPSKNEHANHAPGNRTPDQANNSSSSYKQNEFTQNWNNGANHNSSKQNGQFQQNAFMMMSPYQNQMPMVPGYPSPLMYQQIPMQYPVMYPAYYGLQPPHGMGSYSTGYLPQNNNDMDERQKRYGLTEQGDFKVDYL